MNLKIALAISIVVSAIDQRTFEFMRYISSHVKSYETLAEFEMRKDLYFANDAMIKEWNADESNTSRMGHNFLSDWTEDEKARLFNFHMVDERERDVELHTAPENYQALETFNWCSTQNSNSSNMCSPINSLGNCASSYAFAATETVESAVSIFHGVQPVLVLSA